jgi:enterochelin esterase-like enzyme
MGKPIVRWVSALLVLTWAALARAEQLTVVFTPKEDSEVGRGSLLVVASPKPFATEWAGLMTAYGSRMLAQGVELRAGQSVTLDLSALPSQYKHVGVLLDSNHNFMWRGMPDPGEYTSARVVERSGADFHLRLNQKKTSPSRALPDWMQEHFITSQRVPGEQRMLVGLPPGYADSQQSYPVVFVSHGFNGDRLSYLQRFQSWRKWMHEQPMILVSLDSYGEYGHHLFLDSPGNGPRLQVLREEIIPYLERTFRCNGRRLLYGHSSGGWTVVSLLRRAPDLFAGGVASAPDPLTLDEWWRGDQNNLYQGSAGPRCFAPSLGLTMRRFVECERESDSYGQFSGFLAPFSALSGQPGWLRFQTPFDLETGQWLPSVWEQWKDNDLLHWAQTHPEQARQCWHNKLHMMVGEADEFGLTQTTRQFHDQLQRQGISHGYTEIEGAGHFDLEPAQDEQGWLWLKLAEMATL